MKHTTQKNQKTAARDGQLVLTPKELVKELSALQVASEIERPKRFFHDSDNKFIGVRMASPVCDSEEVYGYVFL